MSSAKEGRKGVGSYLNIYGDFITKNAHAVSQIESALRSLTYIVPGMPPDEITTISHLFTLLYLNFFFLFLSS